jgi:hypothetical protein
MAVPPYDPVGVLRKSRTKAIASAGEGTVLSFFDDSPLQIIRIVVVLLLDDPHL